MGHFAGNDIYRNLGEKIDNLTFRVPWNETLHAILTELYSTEEADVIINMPYTLSPFDRIEKTTNYEKTLLRKILDSLCSKGLVIDLWINDEYQYMPSPIVIGIFEFTMMRSGHGPDGIKKIARLFHKYLQDEVDFYAANFTDNERVSIIRTVPHEEVIKESASIEILDYERAKFLIEESKKLAIGICSCRQTMMHGDEKKCDTPLNTCSSFGFAADFMVRHKFAEEVSKAEMLDNLARSKEMGLVLNADNVRKNITFLCHCCGCCCHALLGISKLGYPNSVVTSSFLAETDQDRCIGCGKCARACPIHAVEMHTIENPGTKKKKKPVTDSAICLGCGVCALKCETGALKLVKRGKRVIHPETTFGRILLQCLERGTLQNQLFDNPASMTHKFMRGFVGGFLKLTPVKKALMSDMLRSTFLNAMKKGIVRQGRGWIAEL
jgi:ferredoxin